MFSLIPPMYKYLGLLLIALAIFGFGYGKGYSGEHDKFIAFKTQVDQHAQDQNRITKEKDAQNEAQTMAVANAYTVDNNRLAAALEQLRKSTNRFSQLPKNADSSKGANETIGQPSGIAGCTQEFYANALEDAISLQKWQDWAVRLNLPVE